MTPNERSVAFIQDMIDYADKAILFVSGMSADAFEADERTQFAVIRAVEVIGEASKNVPAEIRLMAPDIPWREIARTRDRVIHHYFGVRIDVIWQVTQEDLPLLVTELRALLGQLA